MAQAESNGTVVEGKGAGQTGGLWGAIQSSLETSSQAPPLQRCNRSGTLPMSFSQQRLWLLQHAEPSSAVYNLFFGWRITGPLNRAALERALQAIVDRHEIFHTVFGEQNGSPVQFVCADRRFVPAVIDLTALPAEQREPELQRQLKEQSSKPFDLSQWPLFRAFIFRLEENHHALLLVLHHITCDGTSLTTLFRELQLFYGAFSSGGALALPPLTLQYADFAAWQRGWVTDQVLAPQMNYWKDQLKGALPVLDLGISHPRPSIQSSRGATHFFSFSPELVDAIRSFKRSQKVTLFNILLAGFEALIHRYSAQEDILVGIPTAGRSQSELRNIIGFFVNTLVLRTPVTGEITFRDLLSRVEETSQSAFARQDVPFEKLVEELKPKRDLSHSPIFQVMFSYQSLPRRGLELAGQDARMLHIENGTAKFDLTLDLNETQEGIGGFLEYRTELFSAESVQQLAGHLQRLLAAAVALPDVPLWQLSMLSEQERHRLLFEWNHAPKDKYRGAFVHQLIEEQAMRTPEAVAVCGAQGQISYRDLNLRANKMAARLRKLGVGPEVLVGVSVERSIDMIVAVLAVVKCGGAFVPLDPEYPQERLLFMVEDSGMPLVITQKKSSAMFARPNVRVLCVDDLPDTADVDAQAKWVVNTLSRDAAYVIYTSGSTGKPKGVLIEHGPMVQHCLCCQELYQLTPADRVLQFASLNFDTSIEQIFATLMSGARIVLRDRDVWTPEEFQNKLKEFGLTIINIPPAYWHHLGMTWSNAPESVSTHQVRLVLVGGEEMRLQSLEAWQRTPFNGIRLFNSYGPTETTVTATDFEVPSRKAGVPPLTKAPIGRPRTGRTLYILDRWGQPVPCGVPGELYIGGGLLARGYVNRPELTAERFIPDPFSGAPGARLYKTGDLVRYQPDGNLEFLGRVDQQVKIRGFRVELGEIESVIGQYAGVQESAVTVTDELDRKLVGFVVPKSTPAPSSEDLRQFLKSKLPDYMVPSFFVTLEKMPLTPSGKLDRKALPIPADQPVREQLVLPQTAEELAIAQIWCEVLGLKQIGVNENFFELGGHSLLAMQVISRANTAGYAITLAELFETPTIMGLGCKLAQKKRNAQAGPALVPLARKGRQRPTGFPAITPAQAGVAAPRQ